MKSQSSFPVVFYRFHVQKQTNEAASDLCMVYRWQAIVQENADSLNQSGEQNIQPIYLRMAIHAGIFSPEAGVILNSRAKSTVLFAGSPRFL